MVWEMSAVPLARIPSNPKKTVNQYNSRAKMMTMMKEHR
jgi:hypothetical protein